ncbi:MAG TPA: DNA polymerase III subunit gamma/tau [Terriglobales bacterium]|nr:DNA polymerase III subunit gamma/tau [Terriglobales bacterium]
MSQVIARRYRPQSFEEVIGQEPIVRTLRNAISGGRIAHGFIFSGHRGIGKTTVARVLAKALNCQAGPGPTVTPCGECDSCREIRDGNAVDVIEIDAASNRGIDEIRALRERVRYRPARDRYKFFILDEAHQLTGDAFNALLKTLEEPPEWAVFVLATTEPEALPATIRSRCQHFGFRAVPFRVLLDHLTRICGQEGVAAEEDALGLVAEAGEGSVRDALSLLDQAITHSEEGLTASSVRALLGRVSSAAIRELLQAVAADSSRDTLARADQLLTAGVSPAQLCLQLTQAVRNALLAQCSPDLLEVTESERASAVTTASWFREEELTRFLQILLRAAGDLRHGQQERFHLELALLKMLHARRLTGVEEVLASLGAGEPAAPAKPAPVRPVVAAPAPQPPSPPPPPPGIPERRPTDPSAAVLQTLEQQRKTALVSVLSRAQWQWNGANLQLIFAGADASMAGLADQPSARKDLGAACQAALGRIPEIAIVGRPDQAAAAPASAPPPAAGSPEERAAQHPLLRELREKLPTHVLRTRALESDR